jgi:hypothetical protein
MANRYAVQNGNWSDTATWNGGTLPDSVDDVRPNGFTVVIDQDITVNQLINNASSPAVAGGLFYIYGDYNITATTGLSSTGVTVTGGYIKYYNSGSINIIATFLQTRNTLENVNGGTINITGEVRLPSNGITNGRTITNSSNGTINIIGNITCPANPQTGNWAVLNSSNGIINITGDVNGGTTATNPTGIVNNSAGTINVTGNVFGGTGNASTSYGISNASIGTINITGIVTAGTSTTATSAGINSTAAGIINIIGTLQATTTNNAVSSTSTTATNIFSGPLINSGSRNAIYCYNVELYDDVTTRYEIGVSGSNDTITLYSPDQVTGVPSGSDVRVGTIYGPGNELTGSMYVPHPNSVSIGVAVDNTTGSALVKPEDLWNYALTSLTSSNSIGQRLASTATSASNAAIVSSFSS